MKNDSTSNFCKDLIFLEIKLSRSSFCPKCALTRGASETLLSGLCWCGLRTGVKGRKLVSTQCQQTLGEDVTRKMLRVLCYLGRVGFFFPKAYMLSQIWEDFHQDGKKHVSDKTPSAKFQRKGVKKFSMQKTTSFFLLTT